MGDHAHHYPWGFAALLLPLAAVHCAAEDQNSRNGEGSTGGVSNLGGTVGVSGWHAGGASAVTFLGRGCSADVECGERLRCLGTSSLVLSGGPPGGYCTTSCDTNADCAALASNGVCHEFGDNQKYCVLGCEFGPMPLADKCHGRRDVACTTVSDGAACLPRCNDDTDCCPDGDCSPPSFCDAGSGLCRDAADEGAQIGAPCDGPTDESCRGVCSAIEGEESSVFVCTEVCTFGSFPACGWTPSDGSAEAYCYFASDTVVSQGRAAGDAGTCAPLCDCDDDCAEGLACAAFEDGRDVLATRRAGVCSLVASESMPCAGGAGGATPSGSGNGGVAGASETLAGQGGVAGVPQGGTGVPQGGGWPQGGAPTDGGQVGALPDAGGVPSGGG